MIWTIQIYAKSQRFGYLCHKNGMSDGHHLGQMGCRKFNQDMHLPYCSPPNKAQLTFRMHGDLIFNYRCVCQFSYKVDLKHIFNLPMVITQMVLIVMCRDSVRSKYTLSIKYFSTDYFINLKINSSTKSVFHI